MMTERHYDDEALVTMFAAGADTSSDAHLGACTECAEKLRSFALVTDALRDAATWDTRDLDEAPNPNTIATLRAFADTMAAEDAAAEAFLAELLAGPRERWMDTLAAHPEYRTAGTVRRLIVATDKALDTMPADAVEITRLAVEIADGLDPSAHRATSVATLRGQAWRERAYALFYVGEFAEAAFATATAEAHFSGCVVDDYEQARLGIVRALVDKGFENYAPAVDQAQRSAALFDKFGDMRRWTSARLAEVNLLSSRGQFAAARDVLNALEAAVRNTDAAPTHAIVLGNLGYCNFKLGDVSGALRYHEAAADIFDWLGNHTAATRARWNVASILASEGHVVEAMKRLEQTYRDFTRFGMTGPATQVSLELAELLLTERQDFDAVELICREAMQSLQAAGVAHTQLALTALALMREAARTRKATVVLVRHVREYLRRLPEEPNLLFVAPPSP